MVAGLVAAPVLMSVGLALDVSHVARKQAELQHAVDAAVLAVAREGEALPEDKARAIAEQVLASNYDQTLSDVQVGREGTKVLLRAKGGTELAFGGLFGKDEWPLNVVATVDIAYVDYEIGLVLDTTGSMKGGKLAAMKEAVLGLVGTMSGQVADPERLKFAIVPFATFVNVGPQYGPKFDKDGKQLPGTGASWLDLKGNAAFEQLELATGASRFQVYENLGQKWPGCVETRIDDGKGQDIDDTVADPDKPSTLFIPAFGIDEPDEKGYANSYITAKVKPKDKTKKAKRQKLAKYGVASDDNGNPLDGGLLSDVGDILGDILGDEDDDDDGNKGKPAKIKVDTSVSAVTGKPKGPGMGCEMQPITPLTNDYELLKKQVLAFQAHGTTNISEGVSWGTRVLSPGEPFSQGRDKAKNPALEKIMIVLTDGANNFGTNGTALGSQYSSEGYLVDGRMGVTVGGSSATNALMNKKTLAACEYAKKQGVEVYTIRLEEPDVKTGTVLKECASAADHYFDVPTRTMLDEAFEKIGDKIIKLRLSS